MELWEIPSQLVRRHKTGYFPWERKRIYFIGDTQYGASCATEPLREFVLEGLDEGASFMGTGDYIDVMSPSNRERWETAHLYDSSQRSMEHGALTLVKEWLHVCRGTEGRWLGMVQGHHWSTFQEKQRTITSDELIAEKLGAHFLGFCGIVRLNFRRGPSERHSFTIWVHHGTGSGQTLGAPLNTLQRMAGVWPDVDMFVVGHQHKQVAAALPRIHVGREAGMTLWDCPIRLICAGGWLRGYVPHLTVGGHAAAEYPEQKMLVPLAIGGAIGELIPRRTRQGTMITSRATI